VKPWSTVGAGARREDIRVLRIDGYVKLTPICRGERSMLWRGRRRADGLPVVLKTSSADFPSAGDLRKLRREFELGRRAALGPAIGHIVRHLALETAGARLALVMEDFGGDSLDRRVRPGGLPLLEFLELATRIARAVQGMHDAALIHRDICPSNLLLKGDGLQLRFCDLSEAIVTHRPLELHAPIHGC
jgi:histidine kinase